VAAGLLLAGILLAGALVLGGVEAATIMLAMQIGVLALSRPRSALWMSVAFLVYACVFYIRWTPIATVKESGYVGTAVGLATIAMGLGVSWLSAARRRLAVRKNAVVRRFDKAMYAMFGVSLIASVYGMARGNEWSLVARQLFGCLLLLGYYLLARTFFRSAEDIRRWLTWASVAVTAGAAWYTVKLTLLSFSEGAYSREQSPLTFFAGAIGALLFVKLLSEQQWKKRIVMAVSLLFCVLAILLMGARFVAGSLAGTALILLILRQGKHRLLMGLAMLALVAMAVGFALSRLPELIEQGGLPGEIAGRFSPLNVGEDLSYVGRMAEMQSVLAIVKQHPILGAGMGAEVSYYAPESPGVFGTAAYVDNGWGFVLLKMGLLGLWVFVAMLWSFLRFAAREWPSNAPAHMQRVQACLLALLLFGLLSFIGGPTFFQFITSGFMGTTLGALAALAELASRTPSLLADASPRQVAVLSFRKAA
jgi:O-antigen ligase